MMVTMTQPMDAGTDPAPISFWRKAAPNPSLDESHLRQKQKRPPESGLIWFHAEGQGMLFYGCACSPWLEGGHTEAVFCWPLEANQLLSHRFW